jgi:hypothetical protein
VSGIFQKGPIQLKRPVGSATDRSLFHVSNDNQMVELLHVLFTQSAQVCSWGIESTLGASQAQEDEHVDHGDEEGGYQSRYQP